MSPPAERSDARRVGEARHRHRGRARGVEAEEPDPRAVARMGGV